MPAFCLLLCPARAGSTLLHHFCYLQPRMVLGDAVLLLTRQLQYRFVVIKKDIKLCLVSSLQDETHGHTSPGKHSVMPRLNARDYAQNSKPKVLTTPGPHPQTYAPDTLTQPGSLSFLLPPIYLFFPRSNPGVPRCVCVCITLSWLCNFHARMAASPSV